MRVRSNDVFKRRFICPDCGHVRDAWAPRCPQCFSLRGLVLAARTDVDQADALFWAQTGYKPGQRLDLKNPADRAMTSVWLDIFKKVQTRTSSRSLKRKPSVSVPDARARIREVSRRDVRDAALVGQIIAEADLVDVGVICLVDDDDCCGHLLEEHCIAAAVGASERAVWLWLVTSNAIAAPLCERAEEITAAKTQTAKQRIKRLYAWVDSVGGAIADLGVAELHAAALLRDGVLPPGWRSTSATSRRTQ